MKKAIFFVLPILVFTSEAYSNYERVKWLSYLLLVSNQHIMHDLIGCFETKNSDGVVGSLSFLGVVDPPEVPEGSIYVKPELHETTTKALNYLIPLVINIIPTILEVEFEDISALQVIYQAISDLQDQVSGYFASQL